LPCISLHCIVLGVEIIDENTVEDIDKVNKNDDLDKIENTTIEEALLNCFKNSSAFQESDSVICVKTFPPW
jgi:hypothetical protein